VKYLLALCVSFPLAGLTSAQEPDADGPAAPGVLEVAVLPLPSLAGAPAPETASDARADELMLGHHLRLGPRPDRAPRTGARPYTGFPISPLVIGSLLEEQPPGRESGPIRLHLPQPPLVAEGDRAALERARASCEALDALGQRALVHLDAWLLEGEHGPAGSVAPAGDAFPTEDPTWTAAVRSGARIRLDGSTRTAFLAGWSAEVAQNSEVPIPVIGSALSGVTLQLDAWRVEAGEGVLIAGTLDMADAPEVRARSAGARDVGRIELPTVSSVQVRFSGRVDSGGGLRVTIASEPFDEKTWTLVVRASTGGPLVEGQWRMRDVALLESPLETWLLPAPDESPEGAALGRPALVGPQPAGAQGILGASLASGRPIDGSSLGTVRASRVRVTSAPGWLIGPAYRETTWKRVEELARARELGRTRTRVVAVEAPTLRVEFPVAAGIAGRVIVGSESARLLEWDTLIATDASVTTPAPRRQMDGVALRARLEGAATRVDWWTAATTEIRELERGDTTHGLLELPSRMLAGGEARVTRPGETVPLIGGGKLNVTVRP
jgi:hypothetical protein